MKIDIQAREFTAKKDLLDFITAKVEKLGRFYDEIISSEVCLALNKSGTNDNKFCEIKLFIPGKELFASAQCKSFEEAVVESATALERQLEKHKTKIIGKRVDVSGKFDQY